MQVKMKNMAVAGLVVLLVGMLWYRVVYSPMTSKASKAKTAAHDADAQSANLRIALKGTSPSAAKKQTASDKTTLAALPKDPAEAAFFRSLDALHVSSGASWQAVTNGVPAPSGDFNTITVSLTAQGTQSQIAAFLDGLSAMPRLFLADNVALGPASTAAPGSAAQVVHPGALFPGDAEQLSISGRIFSSSGVSAGATTASSGGTTTPAGGTTAPTGAGAPTGAVSG